MPSLYVLGLCRVSDYRQPVVAYLGGSGSAVSSLTEARLFLTSRDALATWWEMMDDAPRCFVAEVIEIPASEM